MKTLMKWLAVLGVSLLFHIGAGITEQNTSMIPHTVWWLWGSANGAIAMWILFRKNSDE